MSPQTFNWANAEKNSLNQALRFCIIIGQLARARKKAVVKGNNKGALSKMDHSAAFRRN